MIFTILASFVSALICLAFFEAIPPMLGYFFIPDRKIRAAILFWCAISMVFALGGPIAFLCSILGTAPVAITHITHLKHNRGRFVRQAFKHDLKRFLTNLATQVGNRIRRLLS